MPLTQFYHTRDPIENLRVHVTLRKIATGADIGGANDSAVGIGATWEYCFRWQEKKLTTAQQNAQTPARKRKQNTPEVDAATGTIPASAPHRAEAAVLCSFVDADNYVVEEELSRHVTDSEPTYLAAAQQRRIPYEHELVAPTRKSNARRAWRRHHREETFRCMHLVASFDLPNRTHKDRERVLCSLRFYANSGLLHATPGFSTPIDLDKEDPATTALKGGPKLSTYRISIGGALFEYTLDNVNDLLPIADPSDQLLLRELQIEDEKQEATRAAVAASREGGDSSHHIYFDELKLRGVVKRRLALVEIVSAQDINASEPVFIEVHLQLPRQQDARPPLVWRLRTHGNKETASRKRSETMRTRMALPVRSGAGCNSLAVFNFHMKFDLELCKSSSKAPRDGLTARDGREEDDHDSGDLLAVSSPLLSLRVFSRDSWGRQRTEGFGETALPAVAGYHEHFVPVAKPLLAVREQLEEFFLGRDESEDTTEQLRSSNTTLHHVNSRLGVQVQSTSANIRVRFNIVEQLAAAADSSHQMFQHAANSIHAGRLAQVRPHALPELRVVKRSVNEILQSVRLEKRLSQLSGGDPLTSMSSPAVSSAVRTALARLSATNSALSPPFEAAEAHSASV